ncbi:hypothetical protein HHX47_DHR4000456 [Lentinula edodes]|nr:hypothetical protein HHX47_DHR4000456 [Lentinula edodes]
MSEANSTIQDDKEQKAPEYQGGRTFNYKEKYPDDEPLGDELNDNSRVFKVYLDEAENFDDDLMRGFRETIDSLLVFAALFSGVVTSFVIATISALQPDYSQITAVLLVEQVQILRAAGNITAINAIPKSSVDLQNASVATDDLWINGLFLASLSLALVTALLSVLVKQWLQAYSSILAGSAQQKALIRQFRYNGFVKWKVPEIVGILPLILHTSLALFLIGLSLYILGLHSSLSWIVVTVTSLTFTFYLGSLLMPQVWLECPYRIPLLFVPAEYIIYPSKVLLWSFRWIIVKFQDVTQTAKKRNDSPEHWGLNSNSKKKDSFPSILQASLKNTELEHLTKEDKKKSIMEDILVWLLSLESNQSIQEILDQPIYGFLRYLEHYKYSKLENYADRVAKAFWTTLPKFKRHNSQKLNSQVPLVLHEFIFSYEARELLKKGTVAHWNYLMSNWKLDIISKYFKYSKSRLTEMDFEKLGITQEWKDNALLEAVSDFYWELVKVLVENGANANAQGGKYETILQAAAFNGNLDAVRFLVENNAEVNARGWFFGNALQVAAYGANVNMVKFLVENNADVNAQGGLFGNALHVAVSRADVNMVKFLIENNADVNAQEGPYGNALQAAAFGGNVDIVKFLVQNNANVNAQGGQYGNALQAAAYGGNVDIVKFLVQNNANVNAQGGQYGNALQAAAYKGNVDIVKFLVQNNANVNAQGGQYGNALNVAAYFGYLDIVKYLVEHSADIMAQGLYGTALQAAKHGKQPDIANFLEPYTIQASKIVNSLAGTLA